MPEGMTAARAGMAEGPAGTAVEVHMGIRSRLTLVALAVMIALLVVAVPAMAGSVAKGSSQMTVGAKYVTELAAKGVDIATVRPATMKVKFTPKDQEYFWLRVPMKSGGTWSPTAFTGKFYHSGSIRIVDPSGVPSHEIFRAEGIQIIATGPNAYAMSVNYPEAATNVGVGTTYKRVTLATSTHKTKITHTGKAYRINGVQFKLTDAGEAAIFSVIGVHLDKTKVIFDTDILPVLK
jgi:hypothetical protein